MIIKVLRFWWTLNLSLVKIRDQIYKKINTKFIMIKIVDILYSFLFNILKKI